MGRYTYVMDCAWVGSVEEVNSMIEDPEWETLTNAEQIISMQWDKDVRQFLVTWRVRKWTGGGEGP